MKKRRASTKGKPLEQIGVPAARGPHVLRLYVAGSGPRSLRAVHNLKRLCDAELAGGYDLSVIDIYKEPQRAGEDHIVAIPTLIKHAPGLLRRIVGDFSETSLLRQSLDL